MRRRSTRSSRSRASCCPKVKPSAASGIASSTAEPILQRRSRSTPTSCAALAELSPLAPLHQPHNLAPIRAIAQSGAAHPAGRLLRYRLPPAQPHLAQAFALPRELTEAGIRRYGFHGLSYEYVSAPAATRSRRSMPTSGSSSPISATAPACARSTKGGASRRTMGFTAVDGLMMGTRCGSIDPGVLHLSDGRARDGCAGAREPDLQEVRAARRFGHFVRHADLARVRRSSRQRKRSTCSSIASSGRSDRLRLRWAASTGWCSLAASASATPRRRREVAAGCAWLGAELDEARNGGRRGLISTDGSRLPMWVVADR